MVADYMIDVSNSLCIHTWLFMEKNAPAGIKLYLSCIYVYGHDTCTYHVHTIILIISLFSLTAIAKQYIHNNTATKNKQNNNNNNNNNSNNCTITIWKIQTLYMQLLFTNAKVMI